ncbi:nucleotide-diphospho-sugar transferase [Epithele typhae]|uniref:nucleotide-diphospho-sugar transferase n=1 Tax=Epithele typhae TaxID=378194 RepID=UPI002007D9F2|nr:nucleotide-diphospho-sugar transferase [Epithele typhae]KAH9916982.1 nucleotide-diphospho-sugar transferase [Epithele typhae]
MLILSSWSPSPTWRAHVKPTHWSWTIRAIILSAAMNIFVLVWTLTHPPSPHRAFSHFDPDRAEGAAGGENVIATTFYTDGFASAVAALGGSLARVNTTARLVMLYIPEQPLPVERVAPPDARDVYYHFVDQYTKLRLWELDARLGARAVVYLDADTLAFRNFDELFALPFELAATPDVFTTAAGFSLRFNAGVLFLRPSSERFRQFMRLAAVTDYPRHEAEQGLLNALYEESVARLPYAYNANLAIKARAPAMWAGMRDEVRVVHYTLVKPFTVDNKRYSLVPMAQLEANARRRGREDSAGWAETYRAYGHKLDACMHLSDIPAITVRRYLGRGIREADVYSMLAS